MNKQPYSPQHTEDYYCHYLHNLLSKKSSVLATTCIEAILNEVDVDTLIHTSNLRPTYAIGSIYTTYQKYKKLMQREGII